MLHVYDPKVDLQGILVVDNTALGPGLGGIAVASAVSLQEVFERARSKTWTCALMDTGFGGAAACIRGGAGVGSKNRLVRAFARNVGFYIPWLFVATQDVDVGKRDMAVFAEEVGDWQGATGKPEYLQGIPHELGVVSFGIGVAIETCLKATDSWMSSPGGIEDADVAIMGFESRGIALAKFLGRRGANLVAVCDPEFTIHNPEGIDLESIPKVPSSAGHRYKLGKCSKADVLPASDIASVDCDVLVCTTNHQVLESGIIRRVRARCVVEGAQGLLGEATSQYFHRNGVLVLPDVLVTAGDAISASAEFQHMSTERAFSMIEAKVSEATRWLIAGAHEQDVLIRRLVESAAQERISAAAEG